jgi:hypothetical protein
MSHRLVIVLPLLLLAGGCAWKTEVTHQAGLKGESWARDGARGGQYRLVIEDGRKTPPTERPVKKGEQLGFGPDSSGAAKPFEYRAAADGYSEPFDPASRATWQRRWPW